MENQQHIIKQAVLRQIGMPEDELVKLLDPFLNIDDTKINLYRNKGETVIRIRSKAGADSAATERLEMLTERVLNTLGVYVYGRDVESLGVVVSEYLYKRRRVMAAADEALGKQLEEAFAQTQNGNAIFDYGEESYVNERRAHKLQIPPKLTEKYDENSPQIAMWLAKRAAKVAKADYGVSTVSGWQVGDSVYVGMFDGKKAFCKTLEVSEENQPYIRWHAAQIALDMIRRSCKQQPIVGGENASAYNPDEWQPAGPPKHHIGKRIALTVLTILLVLIAAYGVLYATGYLPSYLRLDNFVAAMGSLTGFGTKQYDDDMMAKAQSLMQENENVAGVICVPGLDVTQPVAKARDGDNEYYRNHSYTGKLNGEGSVFMDSRCTPLKTNSNTILYGDNGKGTGLLGALAAYANDTTIQNSTMFAFYTGSTAQKYKVVSAFYTDTDLPLDTGSMLNFENYHDYLEFVLNIKVRSLYQMPVDILEGDSFMTLVADADLSDDSRMVVVGRLIREDEDEAVDFTQITPAADTLQPAAYYTQTGTLAPQNLSDTYTYWQNWYLVQNMTNTDIQQNVTMPEIDMPDIDMPDVIVPGTDESASNTDGSSSGSGSGSGSASSSGSGSASSSGSSSKASSSSKVSSSAASSAATASSNTTPSTSVAPPPISDVSTPDPSTEERLTVTMNGTVMTDTATNILSMIVSSEMGTRWSEEAYKAQAVAAHSWIINQQNSGIAAPSVAGKAPTVPVIDAVSQVSHLVMRYNGAVIFAPYTASVAGATQNSEDVWGGSRPYLVSVPSIYDSEASGFYGTVTIGLEEMRGILNAKVPGANLGDDPASWITIDGYTNGTYVGQMTIGGETTFYNSVAGRTTAINGRWFREAIVNGYGLRSAAFTIAFDGEKFLITTSGWGHGCGLSQWGAQFYATKEGWNYQQILTHYYTGVSVEPY